MRSIHLQGIYGEVPAIPSRELKKGNIIIWNFGYKSKVLDIVKETKTQIIVLLECEGRKNERRLGKNRLVAVEV